ARDPRRAQAALRRRGHERRPGDRHRHPRAPHHPRELMQLKPFRIERFYARYEFTTRYMLSSSDCESRSIGELLEFEADAQERLHATWCGYTESEGALELRQSIAAIYTGITPEDVIVASCAEEGIFLLYHALLAPGDHAIVETPCYESALEVARSTGADVSR